MPANNFMTTFTQWVLKSVGPFLKKQTKNNYLPLYPVLNQHLSVMLCLYVITTIMVLTIIMLSKLLNVSFLPPETDCNPSMNDLEAIVLDLDEVMMETVIESKLHVPCACLVNEFTYIG